MSTTSTPPEHIAGNWLIDLDGTLATYEGWKGIQFIGEPVKPMQDRVKKMIAEGKDVRIFTARVFPLTAAEDPEAIPSAEALGKMSPVEIERWQSVTYIRAWCETHLGKVLPITCRKNFQTVEIWDDRAVGVLMNRGIDRETLVAMHLHRVLTAAGVIVVTGDGFAAGADRVIARITRILKVLDDVTAHVDAANNALEYVKSGANQQEQQDIFRARAALTRALPLLQTIQR